MTHKITAKVGANRVMLAKWLINVRSLSAPNANRALLIADELIDGRTYELYLSAEEKAAGEAWCNIEKVVYDNPYAAHFKEQNGYYELRDKGAAGDAEAAIAYCKLELEGLVSHGAMG
jgi:hypothetical protein